MVKVYGKGNCQKCRLTKRKLEAMGIPFESIDVESDPSIADMLLDMGFRELPIVDPNGNGDRTVMWSGFRSEKIKGLAE